MPAARAKNGRFTKSARRATTTAVVVAPAARAPAKRRSSSPYVVASKRRRSKGGAGYAPVKSFTAGGVLGVATTKFSGAYNKLPEIAGTRMIAVAGIAHMARGSIPHGARVAESAAAIAGWEAGKANAGRLGISGNDDEF